jgi:hypothetical protein
MKQNRLSRLLVLPPAHRWRPDDHSAGGDHVHRQPGGGRQHHLDHPAPMLIFTQTGNSLQFSWNTTFGAFRLQAQTNDLSVGLSQDWFDYPGGGTSPVIVPLGATNGAVFFRLISTP